MTKSNKNNEKTNLDENQPDAPTLNANFIANIIYTHTSLKKKIFVLPTHSKTLTVHYYLMLIKN